MNELPSANAPRSGTGTVHFAAFDVDLGSGELRKGGVKIKLYGQPFSVLAILLERPGQVVTREELQRKLWTGDTFVDFEHGLNKAINRVREALGDDADNPRFIETLPRRGYRFLVPVMPAVQPTTAMVITATSRHDQTDAPLRRSPSAHLARRWRIILLTAVTATIVVIAV